MRWMQIEIETCRNAYTYSKMGMEKDDRMTEKWKWALALLLLCAALYGIQRLESIVTQGETKQGQIDVVIDAGHGGKDPGKVGVNDSLEKEINLEIAKKLKEELENCGLTVFMTREEDKGLYDEDAENKQVQDLTRRVERINEIKPSLAISIHQNSYPSPEVSGTQIFYYEHSEEGEKMAGILQNQMEKTEEIKSRPVKGNTTYFLLKRTEVPTLIMECGFLSNQEEAGKLSEEGYQDMLAKAIADGIVECLSGRVSEK